MNWIYYENNDIYTYMMPLTIIWGRYSILTMILLWTAVIQLRWSYYKYIVSYTIVFCSVAPFIHAINHSSLFEHLMWFNCKTNMNYVLCLTLKNLRSVGVRETGYAINELSVWVLHKLLLIQVVKQYIVSWNYLQWGPRAVM